MNLKKVLPAEDYILSTHFSTDEVCRRISDNTDPYRTSASFFERNPGYSKSYEGYIVNNTFEIQRIIGYRNSFLPLVSGYVYSLQGKTHVKIKMRLNEIMLVFFIVGTVVLVTGLHFMGKFFANMDFTFIYCIPFLVVLTIFVLFKIEAGITRKYLAKLLEAE